MVGTVAAASFGCRYERVLRPIAAQGVEFLSRGLSMRDKSRQIARANPRSRDGFPSVPGDIILTVLLPVPASQVRRRSISPSSQGSVDRKSVSSLGSGASSSSGSGAGSGSDSSPPSPSSSRCEAMPPSPPEKRSERKGRRRSARVSALGESKMAPASVDAPSAEELELLKSLPPRPPRLTRQRGFYKMETSRRPFVSRFQDLDLDVYIGNLQMPPSGGI